MTQPKQDSVQVTIAAAARHAEIAQAVSGVYVHHGKPLRGPNDLTLDPSTGGVYFTDPASSNRMNPDGSIHYINPKGKTHTVVKTVHKLVDEDFGWKDPKAADKAGMGLMEYVIGGMDRSFKVKLYRALRAMDEAGLQPGISSGFRDDYRQTLVEFGRGLSSETDLDAVLASVTDRLTRTLLVSRVALFLDGPRGRYTLAAAKGNRLVISADGGNAGKPSKRFAC